MIEPVTVTELKRTLGIPYSYTEEDDRLSEVISAARIYLEQITWSSFITQTRTLAFSLPEKQTWRVLYLPYGPIQSLTSLKYYDLANTQQTVDSGDYFLEAENDPASLTFVDTYTFQSTYNRRNPWEVIFVAGYGSTRADIPQPIKDAIRLTAQAFYRAEDCSESRIPDAAYAILAPYDLHDERAVKLA